MIEKIQANDKDGVEQLLQRGINPSHTVSGLPMLSFALKKRRFGIAQLLIDYRIDINATRYLYEITALMDAVDDRCDERVKFLLDNGADTDLRNAYGETALMQAAKAGSVEMVNLLLEYGADVTIADDNGKTAYDYAKGDNKDKIQSLIFDYHMLSDRIMEDAINRTPKY